jgi:hypothetical protein
MSSVETQLTALRCLLAEKVFGLKTLEGRLRALLSVSATSTAALALPGAEAASSVVSGGAAGPLSRSPAMALQLQVRSDEDEEGEGEGEEKGKGRQ